MDNGEFVTKDSVSYEKLIMVFKAFNEVYEIKEKSDIDKTALVKCFEYCYELAWKVLKKLLEKKGIKENSPRGVFRSAEGEKLIVDAAKWIDFIALRNLTVHTYDAAILEEMLSDLPEFRAEVERFIALLRTL